jgi:DeoR/GlpR family transcriptional regulator of sugar metabolism
VTPDERRTQIVAMVEAGESVTPADLATRFGVSEDSIRRDLRALADLGIIRRVHGGAVPRSPAVLPYTQREGQDPLAKRRIAAAAAARLVGFRTVCLDAGTSVVEVARLLSAEFKGTVVTVSLPVAAELAELGGRPGTEVILVGGRVSGYTRATYGPDTIDALRRYRFDACVLGVCSLDPSAGLTVPDRDEAFVKAAMVERSTLVVAVAVSGKLGTAEPFVIAPTSAVGLLVTDAAESDPTVCTLVQSGVEVVCVPAE